MEQEKIKCIYYIKDNRTDKIIYIGQTKDFKQRKYQHFGNNYIQIIDKYMFEEGRENFIMEKFDIDCTNMTEDEMLQKEDELILQYDTINNGFNMLRSGLISKTKEYDNQRSAKFHKTEKHKEYIKNYHQIEKYKEYQKNLRQTEEYKKYQREYQREYYQKHKEELNKKLRERRLKKKQQKLANETS